jgi:hypothetical protein
MPALEKQLWFGLSVQLSKQIPSSLILLSVSKIIS